MCHSIDKVIQLAMGTFTKSENFKQSLEKLVMQSSQLTGLEVGLEKYKSLRPPVTVPPPSGSSPARKPAPSAPVTYIKVVENPVISMGIFIIREGERIPLHDHPNMHGVIKCLEGRLRILSFSRRETKISELPEKFASENLKKKIELGELFLAESHVPLELGPESSSCVLEPFRSNIHQVESVGGPAAFLDILSPPYNIDPPPDYPDQEERDCNYYRVVGEGGAGLKWLLLIPPPATFFCDSEPYQGPGLSNEY